MATIISICKWMYWFPTVLIGPTHSTGGGLSKQACDESLSGNSKMSKSRIHVSMEIHITIQKNTCPECKASHHNNINKHHNTLFGLIIYHG